MRIHTFDTTLRDGTQGEAISFSVDDKMLIARKLDELGIDYIEGGWPGSNPKDKEFFEQARGLKLKHAKLTAFGSTRFAKNTIQEDRNVRELIDAGTPCITIFGKSWDLHVSRALGITENENLTIIAETVRYLKDHGKEVVYDAEHFFDGYIHNRDFALRTLEAAKHAGADVLCLCDTNGGTLTNFLAQIVADVRARFDGIIGIHTHNDSEVAVANALAAIEKGASHVQGCLNGYGERCGNSNLASIIANLELKLGHTTIGPDKLQSLTSVCRYIAELANLPLRKDQAYVGQSAFAHKGGVHVSAVMKDSSTYEHVAPELVGNHQRVLVSDLSGRSNVLYQLQQQGLADRMTEQARRDLLERVKEMEFQGYDLEAADGTFELFVRQSLQPGRELLRSAGLRRRDQIRPRDRGGHGRDGRGNPDRDRRGPRPDECARCRAAQMPLCELSANRRCSPDRLQGARSRFEKGDGRQSPRAGRMVGPPEKLVNCWRFRRRDRSQLERIGRCPPP